MTVVSLTCELFKQLHMRIKHVFSRDITSHTCSRDTGDGYLSVPLTVSENSTTAVDDLRKENSTEKDHNGDIIHFPCILESDEHVLKL